MAVLAVPTFGGGVALEGSADTQRTDELRAADSYDIGHRGQLVAASDVSDYLLLEDNAGGPAAWSRLYALMQTAGFNFSKVLAVGEGDSGAGTTRFILTSFQRIGETSPYLWASGGSIFGAESGGIPAVLPAGVIITAAALSGVFWIRFAAPGGAPGAAAVQVSVYFVNIGAREGFAPNTAPGLYMLSVVPPAVVPFANNIERFDSLGTGSSGLFTVPTVDNDEGQAVGGTHGKKLNFRGIAAYNGHVFGWGFDAHDLTNGDGPTRVMFSNIGNGLKWGNDPGPVGTDRAFADSDAIVIAGESKIIRAGIVWAGRLWLGMSDGLHFIEGYGRESFLTNGATPIRQSLSVAGPHCMIEGPDGLLYAVGPQGLWAFNGSETIQHFRKLTDYTGKSPGYWDLIWADTTRTLASYPGQTNQDLVWMYSDRDTMQVCVVIPWCDATAGYGYGTDTVIVKFNVETGGFTRQVLTGQQVTCGALLTREPQAPRTLVMGTPGSAANVKRYGFKASLASSPVMPTGLPDVTFGEYAPHGPDGTGISHKLYLTLSWESVASLPLVFSITPSVDQEAIGPVVLTIGASAPGAPADGDVWMDTSGTDTNIGNGTAGTIIPSHPGDYLVKTWKASWAKWVYTGDGGEQGTRASIPIGFSPARGTRVKHRVQCTSAAGRYQIEGLGLEPSTIRSDR